LFREIFRAPPFKGPVPARMLRLYGLPQWKRERRAR
jgi:hypothetical protein